MTYIYADRHTVNIEIEMDAIVCELPNDFLIDLVIERGIETEMLGRIDEQTIIDYVSSEQTIIDCISSDKSDDNNVDLSTVDDDDLLNEVRQRFA